MSKVVVYHAGYGCDTGCCGHVIEIDDKEYFDFSHPDSNSDDDKKKYAEELVEEKLGRGHIKDLDWENCQIYDC